MTYTAECDDCGDTVDEPGLLGQFREDTWMGTDWGDRFAQLGYELGDTITLCPDCTYALLDDG